MKTVTVRCMNTMRRTLATFLTQAKVPSLVTGSPNTYPQRAGRAGSAPKTIPVQPVTHSTGLSISSRKIPRKLISANFSSTTLTDPADLNDEEWVNLTPMPSMPLEPVPPAFPPLPIVKTKSSSSSKSCKHKGAGTHVMFASSAGRACMLRFSYFSCAYKRTTIGTVTFYFVITTLSHTDYDSSLIADTIS
jgi:hypothetical protein